MDKLQKIWYVRVPHVKASHMYICSHHWGIWPISCRNFCIFDLSLILPLVLRQFSLFTTQYLFNLTYLHILNYSLNMGNQKTAAKWNPTSDHSGAWKSKQTSSCIQDSCHSFYHCWHRQWQWSCCSCCFGFFWPAQAWLKVFFWLHLWKILQRSWWRRYNGLRTIKKIDDEGEGNSESEEDQLMESESGNEDNSKLQHLFHWHILDSMHQISSTSLLVPHLKSDRNSTFHLKFCTKMLHKISPGSLPWPVLAISSLQRPRIWMSAPCIFLKLAIFPHISQKIPSQFWKCWKMRSHGKSFSMMFLIILQPARARIMARVLWKPSQYFWLIFDWYVKARWER